MVFKGFKSSVLDNPVSILRWSSQSSAFIFIQFNLLRVLAVTPVMIALALAMRLPRLFKKNEGVNIAFAPKRRVVNAVFSLQTRGYGNNRGHRLTHSSNSPA